MICGEQSRYSRFSEFAGFRLYHNARLFNQIRHKERLLGFNVDNIGVNIVGILRRPARYADSPDHN